MDSCQEKNGVGTPSRGLPEIFDLSGPAGDGGLEHPLGPVDRARPNWAKINDGAAMGINSAL